MWTVRNLVERLSHRYEFMIVTRNSDGKHDPTPYPSVTSDDWNGVGLASVYYASPERLNSRHFRNLIREKRPDLIFLNSVFSRTALRAVLSRRWKDIASIPMVVAPCGELSDGSMAFKTTRKKFLLAFGRALGVLKGITLKASTEEEAGQIRETLGKDVSIKIAADLLPSDPLPDISHFSKPTKHPGELRLAFLSRIAPKKQLDLLLSILAEIDEGSVVLDIGGPKDDEALYERCVKLAAKLPANVRAQFLGPLKHEEGIRLLAESHFFILPTLNENFGYVIFEALACATPVLLSENVIWQDIEARECGWIIRLEHRDEWKRRIIECIRMDADEYARYSSASRRYAIEWLSADQTENDNLALIENVIA